MEKLIKLFLKEIGEDVEREGLKDTPKRVAKMYEELFKGYDEKQKPFLTFFPNIENYDQMILDKTYFFSFCEHHVIPFFGDVYIAYIPDRFIVGLSKLSRLVDFYASRLQTQERLTQQIANHLQTIVEPKGVGVMIKARHLCREMRGVKKVNGKMITSCLKGAFLENVNTKQEFLSLVNKNG